MKVKEITSLGVVGAAGLRDLAASGDEDAKSKYLMYSSWKQIRAKAKELNTTAGYEAFTKKDCIKVLITLGSEAGVRWQA